MSPRGDLYLHVVDDGVHVSNGVALGLQLLPAQLERHPAGGIELAGDELELDQQPGRAAGIVVTILAGPGAHDVGHQEADLGRGEELARALAGTFRELAQQVLVGAAEEVGLYIGKAQPVAGIGEGFDHGGELGRVDVALAVALRREIDQVDDARERGVFAARRPGQPWSGVPRCLGGRVLRPWSSTGQSWDSRPLMMPHRACGGR